MMKQGEVWNIFFILISSVSTTHVKYAYKKSDIMISISRNNRLISFIDKSFFYFSKQVYFGHTNDNKCSKIIIILFL